MDFNMPKVYYLCFLFFFAGLSSCKVSREEDPVVIYTGETEYRFDLFEKRDSLSGDPTFGLWVESMKTYDAGNYSIDHTVDASSQQININMLGVQKPASGVGAAGPAKTFIPIGHLQDGDYQMNISLAGAVVNKASLHIAAGHYSLSLPNPEGILFQNLVMDHIPVGTIWGYAGIANESQQPVANAFILDLKPISADPGLPPGYYSYFTVSGTGDVFLHNSMGVPGKALPFVRKLTGSRVELTNLLQSYRAQPIAIRCLTTFGEE
jgi:hypothetical protein